MELADVELLAELVLGVRAQLLDLELTRLVRKRLSGRGDVAVDLHDDVVLRLGRVGGEVVDRILPRHVDEGGTEGAEVGLVEHHECVFGGLAKLAVPAASTRWLICPSWS